MPLAPIDAIETARLTLVPVADEHLDDLLAVNGDDEVTRFVPYKTWTSRGDAEAWLARMAALVATGTTHQLVLKRRADGRAIGTLLLFKYDEGSQRIELGYALGRDAWGQGLMGEAVTAACDHAFGAMGIRRIEAEVNPANTASCALLERAGFVHEGTMRQRWTGKGVTYDTRMYGLLGADRRETVA
jgi:RimJ/RimL family protein N-acetyltransferase